MSFKKLELMGSYYGYPSCCIKWFINKRIINHSPLTKKQESVHHNEGFIPCPICAELITSTFKITDLISNRICPSPYPLSTSEEEVDKWLTQQMQSEV